MLCQPNNHLSESNQLAVYMYTSAALAQTRTDSKNITCTVSLMWVSVCVLVLWSRL